MTVADGGKLALEGWQLVRQMLDDMTAMVEADAETELELLEGLRVLGPDHRAVLGAVARRRPGGPWFFPMNTEARLIGGTESRRRVLPRHDRRPPPLPGARATGARSAYLGFQVLAGVGLTPRRHGAPTSRTVTWSWPTTARSPSSWRPRSRGRRSWRGDLGGHPRDASAIVVREYIADRAHRDPRRRSPSSRSTRRARRPSPPTPAWASSSRRWRGRSPSWPPCTARSSPSCSSGPTSW